MSLPCCNLFCSILESQFLCMNIFFREISVAFFVARVKLHYYFLLTYFQVESIFFSENVSGEKSYMGQIAGFVEYFCLKIYIFQE